MAELDSMKQSKQSKNRELKCHFQCNWRMFILDGIPHICYSLHQALSTMKNYVLCGILMHSVSAPVLSRKFLWLELSSRLIEA